MIEDLLRQIDHETVTAPQRVQESVPMIRLGRSSFRSNRSDKKKKADRRRAKVAKVARKGNWK